MEEFPKPEVVEDNKEEVAQEAFREGIVCPLCGTVMLKTGKNQRTGHFAQDCPKCKFKIFYKGVEDQGGELKS